MKFVWMPPRCRFLVFACLKFFSFISSCNGPGQGAVAGAAAMIEIATQAWALPAVTGDKRWVRAHAPVSQGLLLVFESDSAEK